MAAQLGWVWLSQTERQAAEAALEEQRVEGARDELGLGVLHFAYADRFFPGTSVLHTSLRYIFFVCWAYQELVETRPGETLAAADLATIEDRTCRKLLAGYGGPDGNGIIGGRVLSAGRAPVTRPSRIYWNALRLWGFLSAGDQTGEPPGQGDVHRRWGDFSLKRRGPEADNAAVRQPLFVDIPPPPDAWRKEGATLDFTLGNEERERIRSAWRPARPNDKPSLLARLADRGVAKPRHMYARKVAELCDSAERGSLERARQVGALAGIGRGLYAAMVDRLRQKDGASDAGAHEALLLAREEWRDDALKLDLNLLPCDVPRLGDLKELLQRVQEWTRTGGDYGHLLEPFRRREVTLKGDRALLREGAQARRLEWTCQPPQPLNYRWPKVAHFLTELEA